MEPPRLVVALGSTDQLQVRQTDRPTVAGDAQNLDVQQVLALRLQPGSVVLDCLLNFKVVVGRVREIELATDPRLAILPLKGDPSAIARVTTVSGDVQRVRLELARPVAGKLSLSVSFLLKEASGVGAYRLPFLDVIGARTTKRWLAVWVDPALEYTRPAPSSSRRSPSRPFSRPGAASRRHPRLPGKYPRLAPIGVCRRAAQPAASQPSRRWP